MSAVTQEVDRSHSRTTSTTFTRLLHWLDEGVDSHGERYLEMRRRLVSYFDRRNRPAPDVLADETFDRIARTLETMGRIKVTPPARYCYVVARFVLLEDIRAGRRSVPFDEARMGARQALSPAIDAGDDPARQALACLGRCLGRLKPEDRELIVEYYRDAKRERIDRRRALAEKLGITMNALGIRAWRLRASLEACVGACRKV
jgi:DNA-directed RNA polymerase specialized sigma24 family protein